jgi:PPK2 family polyphosphate:nucleotide phosphotransferase
MAKKRKLNRKLNRKLQAIHKLIRRYRVTDGESFRLRDFDPDDTAGLTEQDRPAAQAALREGIESLVRLQNLLYAQDRWALLRSSRPWMRRARTAPSSTSCRASIPPAARWLVQGPSPEEQDHDFLWRCARHLPERGRIGIFNRSYYEEVLVVRVHPEILAREKLAPELLEGDLWERRFEDIRGFERFLSRNGTAIVKFFLYVSPGEQRCRFLERLDDPAKQWKFSAADLAERARWKRYMHAYEEAIRATARKHAPWYVVPADHKWFTRIVVAAAMVDALEALDMSYPKLDAAQRAELNRVRRALAAAD